MDKSYGLYELMFVLAKHKRLIIWICFVAALSAIAYSLLTPKYWKSSANIMPVVESGVLGSLNTSLADIMGGNLINTPKSEMAVDFVTVMKRRSFSEQVINKFDLINYYRIERPDSLEAMELALRILLTKTMRFNFDQESNLVQVTAETKDKKMSRDIVQFYIDNLESYNISSRMSKGRLKRIFLEQQVNNNMAQADSLARKLRDFEQKNKAISIDDQTKSLVSLYSDTAAKLMQTEIEYELARKQYEMSSPVVTDLADKISLLKKAVKDMESSNSQLTPDYFIQIDKIPNLSMQYAQLMINVDIRRKVIEYLYPQYELAKIDELKDLPTFEVMDSPNLAGLRSKPKRALIVVLTTFAAFLIACILAFVKESLFEDNKDRTAALIKALFGR